MALGLFAVLWFVVRKWSLAPFQLFSAYMVMAGVERMLIESIREHGVSLYDVAGLSFSQAQLISLALMLFGVLGWIWSGRNPLKSATNEKVD
jgi:prolipoprotein diacylglyceryltransferase